MKELSRGKIGGNDTGHRLWLYFRLIFSIIPYMYSKIFTLKYKCMGYFTLPMPLKMLLRPNF